MFEHGQKVVCLDDEFAPWCFDLYKELPKKNHAYTVREIGVGRSNPTFNVNEDAKISLTGAEFDIAILLYELVNPDDPHSNVKQELGFRAERFAPLDEFSEHEHEYTKLPDCVTV